MSGSFSYFDSDLSPSKNMSGPVNILSYKPTGLVDIFPKFKPCLVSVFGVPLKGEILVSVLRIFDLSSIFVNFDAVSALFVSNKTLSSCVV